MANPQVQEIATIDPNAVFSVGEAARMLGVSHNGVLNRIKKGGILAGRSGYRYFISGKEIQRQIVMPPEVTPTSPISPTATEL